MRSGSGSEPHAHPERDVVEHLYLGSEREDGDCLQVRVEKAARPIEADPSREAQGEGERPRRGVAITDEAVMLASKVVGTSVAQLWTGLLKNEQSPTAVVRAEHAPEHLKCGPTSAPIAPCGRPT